MARIEIKDFKAGMNRTRSKRRGPAGSLWVLKNAVINRGGDIERSKKFVPYADLSGFGTKGLAAIDDLPVTFSHEPVAAPENTQVQVLEHPTGLPIDRILCVEAFDDKLYVIAQFTDGSVHHYYDRQRVTNWGGATAPVAYGSINDVAALLASRIDADARYSASAVGSVITVAGPQSEAFSFSGFVEDKSGAGDQSVSFNVTQGAADPGGETPAKASFRVASGSLGSAGLKPTATFLFTRPDSAQSGTLNSLLVGVTELVTSPITLNPGESAALAADQLETQINAGGHGFTAIADGPAVFVTGPDFSDTLNGVDLIPAFIGAGLGSDASRFLGGENPANRITDIRVNGVSQIASPILYGATPQATAAAIKTAMDAASPSPNYDVAVSGQRVTLTAQAGAGAGANGFQLVFDVEGDVVFDQLTNFTGGVSQGPAAPQIIEATIAGTFNGKDRYVISLGNRRFEADIFETGIGSFAWAYKSKMYVVARSFVLYSKLNDPLDFADTANGAGFVNVPNQRKGDRRLTTIGEYQNFAAIFSGEDAKVFAFFEDDDLNRYDSSVDNVGCIAPGSVLPFGNRDVFFLSTSGIRSLRPRDSSGAAYAEDVGTLIDPFVSEVLGALTEDALLAANAISEPLDGRYWLPLGDKIFVFSYFPSAVSKISAWSFFEPGFSVDGLVRATDNRVYARSGDQIYLYGGEDNMTYPDEGETPAVVELCFLDGDNPAAIKMFRAYDADVENLWDIEAAFDENQPDNYQPIGSVDRSTFISGEAGMEGEGASVGLRFTCSAAGFAKLSQLVIHYDAEQAR